MHYLANQLCKCTKSIRNWSLTVAELHPFSKVEMKGAVRIYVCDWGEGGICGLSSPSQSFKATAIN